MCPPHAWVNASTRNPVSGAIARSAGRSPRWEVRDRLRSFLISSPCASRPGAGRDNLQGVPDNRAGAPVAAEFTPANLRGYNQFSCARLLALRQFPRILHDSGRTAQSRQLVEHFPLVTRGDRSGERGTNRLEILGVASGPRRVNLVFGQLVKTEKAQGFLPASPVAETQVHWAIGGLPQGRRFPAIAGAVRPVFKSVSTDEQPEHRPRRVGQRQRLDLGDIHAFARTRSLAPPQGSSRADESRHPGDITRLSDGKLQRPLVDQPVDGAPPGSGAGGQAIAAHAA